MLSNLFHCPYLCLNFLPFLPAVNGNVLQRLNASFDISHQSPLQNPGSLHTDKSVTSSHRLPVARMDVDFDIVQKGGRGGSTSFQKMWGTNVFAFKRPAAAVLHAS